MELGVYDQLKLPIFLQYISISMFSQECRLVLFLGSMICVGRSNYFRFNHPEEAERMKTILPNARISSVPMSFANASSAAGIPSPPSATSPEPPGTILLSFKFFPRACRQYLQ